MHTIILKAELNLLTLCFVAALFNNGYGSWALRCRGRGWFDGHSN